MIDRNNQIAFSFEPDGERILGGQNIKFEDACLTFWQDFYTPSESHTIFSLLITEIAWRQDWIEYYGKTMPLPRLTAWYGDKGSKYKYSGIGMDPARWTPLLSDIRTRIQNACGATFNSVLLNRYRNGADGVSWHRDNEKELGDEPVIASLSFGEARRFQFRHISKKALGKHELLLTDGSLLVMTGPTQKFWEHQVPKSSRPMGERINLTFRMIY